MQIRTMDLTSLDFSVLLTDKLILLHVYIKVFENIDLLFEVQFVLNDLHALIFYGDGNPCIF